MNQSTKYQKTLLPLKKYKGSPKVILSSELIAQINTLHSEIGSDEWSGVLLYKVIEGDITEPDNLVINCVGLFLMDIGTSAFTSFDTDVDSIIALSQAYPEYEEGKLLTGLIHTHHRMSTTPSKTDDEELQENAEAFNAYLSLIVNFSLEPSARLAFVVNDVMEHKYKFINIKGKNIVATQTVEEKMVMYYDCDVSLQLNSSEEFNDRIKELKEKKKNRVKITPKFNKFEDDDILDFYNNTNKYGSGVIEQNQIRSFLCKLISLNEFYLGSDLSTCINRMNSKLFSNKDIPVNKIKEKYSETIEDIIDKCFKSVFGFKVIGTDEEFGIFVKAAEMLEAYKSFAVAEILRDLFLEYIGIEDEKDVDLKSKEIITL